MELGSVFLVSSLVGNQASTIITHTPVNEQMRMARKAAGLTLRQASKLTKLSSGMICNIEHGHFGTTLSTLYRIAKAYNCTFFIGPECSQPLAVGVFSTESESHQPGGEC